MPSELKSIMSIGLGQKEQQNRSGRLLSQALHGSVNWVLGSLNEAPPEIKKDLARQSLAKPKTLIVATACSTLLAAIAAAISAEPWAYVWLLAQVVAGSTRLLVMVAFIRADASGRPGNTAASVSSGLLSFTVFSAGCYECVVSGDWPLILMAGVAIASLMGGVASRDAGTPRYGTIIISIMVFPFALAALRSPIPHLFLIGIQLPLYAAGVIFVMLENSKILLHLHHSERENRRLAQHDPLTGLPNRALNLQRFDELLKGLRSAHGRLRQEFMVFCLDLDGFKELNDSFGHAAGDAVLVAVARRLHDCVRPLDFISRIGGDEFVILLPGIASDDAETTADRIIASVAQPFDLGLGEPVHIGISIGSACAPEDGETAEELLRSADRALYEAKRRGKGTFVAHGGLKVALAPKPDADTRMAGLDRREKRTDHFPLPFRSKSV
jgi:diguanylate cyclase (GGDEF)-like protein